MKKWIALLLALVLMLSLAACDKKTKSRRPASPVFRTNTAQPNAVQPDSAQSEAVPADAAQTDAAQSDTAQPDTVQPDTVQPDTVQPDTVQPDIFESDTSQPDNSIANASGEGYTDETPVQNSPANKEVQTGSVSLANPISVYLADSGLPQELIFPSGADGAVVQNGALHFNPHGEDAAAWFEQVEMAAAIVSDDGTIEGTAQTGLSYTANGNRITVTCTADTNDDWYLVIG